MFDSWSALGRTAAVGVLAYIGLVTLLRIGKPRTLSKMNAFDLVVTVAIGSALSIVLLDKNVALAQGMLAVVLLIGLQFIITWSSVRVRWVRHLVTGEPTLLLYRGAYLPQALRRARVTESEVRAAVRAAGLATIEDVEAVVLETDGSFSVVHEGAKGAGGGRSSLADVELP